MDTAASGNGDTDRTAHRLRFEIGCVKLGEQKRKRDGMRVRIEGITRVFSAKIIRFGFWLSDFCGV